MKNYTYFRFFEKSKLKAFTVYFTGIKYINKPATNSTVAYWYFYCFIIISFIFYTDLNKQ